jgi:hypothetical protein
MIVIPTLQIRTLNIFKYISSLPLSCQNVHFWNQVIYQHLCQRWTVSSHLFFNHRLRFRYLCKNMTYFILKQKRQFLQITFKLKFFWFSVSPLLSPDLPFLKKQMIVEFSEKMIGILHEFVDKFLEQLNLSVK